MRNQNLSPTTGGKLKKSLLLIGILLAVLAVALFVWGKTLKYTPPKFDASATSGTPEVDEGYLYEEIASEYGYNFSIAANLYQQENGSCNVYLTNPSVNQVYLMCKIEDADSGKVLYESGIVKPGEFVENIAPSRNIKNEQKKIKVSIYGFAPDTWYSEGTTTLNLLLQPW